MERNTGSPPGRPSRAPALVVDVVVAACAISAGVHAALVPAHLHEEPRMGIAFILSAIALLAVGAALVVRPASRAAAAAAALLLAALIGAYVANVTTGLPALSDGPEPADVVGVATKLVELIGLVGALTLTHIVGGRRSPAPQEVLR